MSAPRTILALTHAAVLRATRFHAPFVVSSLSDMLTAIVAAYTVRDLQASLGYDIAAYSALGVVTLLCTMGAATATQMALRDPAVAPMRYYLRSPASAHALAAGTLLSQALIKAASSILVAASLGIFVLHLTVPSALLLFGALAVAALFGASAGAFASALIPELRVSEVFVYIFFVLQFFLCGGFVPATQLPLVLRIARRVMPFEYAIDLVRRAYFYGMTSPPPLPESVPLDLVVLASVGTLLWLGAGRVLGRAR